MYPSDEYSNIIYDVYRLVIHSHTEPSLLVGPVSGREDRSALFCHSYSGGIVSMGELPQDKREITGNKSP